MRMRTLQLGLIGLLASCSVFPAYAKPQEGNFYGVRYVDCFDGDTCTFLIPWLPPPLTFMKVRVPSIDTPERYTAKCPGERALAEEARVATNDRMRQAKTIDLLHVGPAELFGRHPATITFEDGDDLGSILLREGHAVISEGKRTMDWCAEYVEPLPGGHP